MKKLWNKLLDYIAKMLTDRVLERLQLNSLHIAALDIQPGDIIVVKSDHVMHGAARQAVLDRMNGLFPQNLTIVMDQLDLSLIRPRRIVGNHARPQKQAN